MSNKKCFNCGADYGLHHHETNQCPLDGFESYPKPQQWQETTFEERGRKLKEIAANDLYEALKTTLEALRDILRQLPKDERLADYRLDFAEQAEALATAALSKAEGK